MKIQLLIVYNQKVSNREYQVIMSNLPPLSKRLQKQVSCLEQSYGSLFSHPHPYTCCLSLTPFKHLRSSRLQIHLQPDFPRSSPIMFLVDGDIRYKVKLDDFLPSMTLMGIIDEIVAGNRAMEVETITPRVRKEQEMLVTVYGEGLRAMGMDWEVAFKVFELIIQTVYYRVVVNIRMLSNYPATPPQISVSYTPLTSQIIGQFKPVLIYDWTPGIYLHKIVGKIRSLLEANQNIDNIKIYLNSPIQEQSLETIIQTKNSNLTMNELTNAVHDKFGQRAQFIMLGGRLALRDRNKTLREMGVSQVQVKAVKATIKF